MMVLSNVEIALVLDSLLDHARVFVAEFYEYIYHIIFYLFFYSACNSNNMLKTPASHIPHICLYCALHLGMINQFQECVYFIYLNF